MKYESLKQKILLCLGLIFFVPFLLCYLIIYDLKTWKFWHNTKYITYLNGKTSEEEI
jgi:hypothetical protein